MPEPEAYERIAAALLEVAKIRYNAFRERFGRDPEPDEPLLFDPKEEEPIAASGPERIFQVLAAALVSDSDAAPVLHFLGFGSMY
jgi:hypothetical protein